MKQTVHLVLTTAMRGWVLSTVAATLGMSTRMATSTTTTTRTIRMLWRPLCLSSTLRGADIRKVFMFRFLCYRG